MDSMIHTILSSCHGHSIHLLRPTCARRLPAALHSFPAPIQHPRSRSALLLLPPEHPPAPPGQAIRVPAPRAASGRTGWSGGAGTNPAGGGGSNQDAGNLHGPASIPFGGTGWSGGAGTSPAHGFARAQQSGGSVCAPQSKSSPDRTVHREMSARATPSKCRCSHTAQSTMS